MLIESDSSNPNKSTCEHHWVFIRKTDDYETGYRRWAYKNLFYCDKCLEHKAVEIELQSR